MGRGTRASRLLVVTAIATIGTIAVPALGTPAPRFDVIPSQAASVASAELLPTTVPTTTSPTAPTPAAASLPARRARIVAVTAARSPAEIGAEALRLVRYPWLERLHATITFAGPRSGMRSQSTAYRDHEVITV